MSVGDCTRPTRISVVPPEVLFFLVLSLLSLPLGASQVAAGGALLRRLASAGVGGDQILVPGGCTAIDASVFCGPASTATTSPPSPPLPQQRHLRRSGPAAADRVLPRQTASTSSRCRPTPGPRLLRAPTEIYWVRPCRLPVCRGQKIGNPEMHFSRDELIGSAFIAFGIILFVCFFYVAIVSKLLPPYENQFLAAIQEDWYYCLLVPLTLPVIIVAVYLHWLSMKMFKHA